MVFSENIKQWIHGHKVFLIHILVWGAFFLLPIIFNTSNFSDSEIAHHNQGDFFYLNLINKLLKVGFFYLNAQLLIPQLLYQKKYTSFLISQAAIFAFLLFLDFLLFQILNIKHSFHVARSAYHNLSLFLFILLASIVYKTLWDKTNTEKIENERQKETLQTELSFLRSQISPHFLFNILNNIVAMIRLKSEGLEETVVKLSTLLQYMLYETDEEKVALQNEVEYLESYIDLQNQRFGSKIKIKKQIDMDEMGGFIEPMLLIPFVENAFKHGYGMIENPEIRINLNVKNQRLSFEVKNKFNPENQQKDKTSGIGLANVKRRLELLYSNDYQLLIEQKENWFSIKLALHLKNRLTNNKAEL